MRMVFRSIRRELNIPVETDAYFQVWNRTEAEMHSVIRRVFEVPLMVSITGHVWQIPVSRSETNHE